MSKTDETRKEPQLDPKLEQEILRAVRDVKYGSVEVVIHDSRVVQVERREKIRLPHQESGRPQGAR